MRKKVVSPALRRAAAQQVPKLLFPPVETHFREIFLTADVLDPFLAPMKKSALEISGKKANPDSSSCSLSEIFSVISLQEKAKEYMNIKCSDSLSPLDFIENLPNLSLHKSS